jgi:hypothetical protein
VGTAVLVGCGATAVDVGVGPSGVGPDASGVAVGGAVSGAPATAGGVAAATGGALRVGVEVVDSLVVAGETVTVAVGVAVGVGVVSKSRADPGMSEQAAISIVADAISKVRKTVACFALITEILHIFDASDSSVLGSLIPV